MNWITKYEPGDLIWLHAEDYPTIPGTVVNRSKTEVFVRTIVNGKDEYLAIEEEEAISHRDRSQVLSMAGMVIGKKK